MVPSVNASVVCSRGPAPFASSAMPCDASCQQPAQRPVPLRPTVQSENGTVERCLIEPAVADLVSLALN